MELTHKLLQPISENVTTELSSRLYANHNDNHWLLSATEENCTSMPIRLLAGETISFVSKCSTKTLPIGNIKVTGWQRLLMCVTYKEGEECSVEAVAEKDGTFISYTAASDCYVLLVSYYADDIVIQAHIKKQYTEILIDEPIGFDNLKMTMKRHEYHGMGAEVSLDNLEFYGQAFTIIKQAYETDIDSEIIYTVLADSEEIYSGKIDLSTYSLKQGDYQSISVKVGEIGVKTTFNNRLDTEVDLNKCETIDGIAFDKPNWLNLHIPSKHLLYTNKLYQKENVLAYQYDGVDSEGEIVINEVKVNEYGVVVQDGKLFYKNNGFNEKFGEDTQSILHGEFKVNITWDSVAIVESATVYGKIILYAGTDEIASTNLNMIQKNQTYTLKISQTITTDTLTLKYKIWKVSGQVNYSGMKIKILAGSYLNMTMYDNLAEEEPVNADMLLTHDALNVVAQAISENALTVKSSWYQAPESKWNAGTLGGGALKALTNGYKIRGLFTDEDNERNMPLSFKDLIKSLSAQDCIGWGFSTEDGETCVRVERWDWFYKDNVILTLDNVTEVQTDIDPDRIITELTIGYKKYATNDQYNSIESPHGTRTFVNGIKAVSNAVSAECEFIADNYAIEETRRAATQKNETEESSYDENLFIFELAKTNGQPAIEHTATNLVNGGRQNEFINAKLTPRHMASRWRDYLFAANNTTIFAFKTGELNYNTSFAVYGYLQIVGNRQILGLTNFATNNPQKENDDIQYVATKYKAEKISFSYPLTVAEYATVKANPYGLISVNGQQGWIVDFKYSFADGLADFTLIAKH